MTSPGHFEVGTTSLAQSMKEEKRFESRARTDLMLGRTDGRTDESRIEAARTRRLKTGRTNFLDIE